MGPNLSSLVVLGLGRSGVSAAKAAIASGANVIAVDEKSGDDPIIANAVRDLGNLGVDVRPGWKKGLSETGAQTVVTSPGVPRNHELLLEAVRNGQEVISEIELAYRIAKAPIVAITGTNGKSTTTVMSWLCAKAAGYDAVLCGNIYGSGYEEVPLTEAASGTSTPLPPSSSAAGGGGKPALIAEVSSFQLEWVNEFRPKAATITNITPDHLNRYESFEDYADTKRRIFQRMGDDDRAVWHDGDFSTEPPHGIKVLTYGDGAKHSWIDGKRMHLAGACIELSELPFQEPHNYLNAMSAGLLVYGLSDESADPQKILHALKSFRGLAHRMERLGEKNGVKLINNSMCTNPAAVISSSRAIEGKQRLLIGGVNKGLEFGPVGEYLREEGHAAYLFGTDGPAIAEAMGRGWLVFRTMAEAFAAAASDAKPGETIMLAPGVASMDQFVDFRDRGEAFRQLAMEWLK